MSRQVPKNVGVRQWLCIFARKPLLHSNVLHKVSATLILVTASQVIYRLCSLGYSCHMAEHLASGHVSMFCRSLPDQDMPIGCASLSWLRIPFGFIIAASLNGDISPWIFAVPPQLLSSVGIQRRRTHDLDMIPDGPPHCKLPAYIHCVHFTADGHIAPREVFRLSLDHAHSSKVNTQSCFAVLSQISRTVVGHEGINSSCTRFVTNLA